MENRRSQPFEYSPMNLKDLSSIALLAGLLASSIPAHAYDANGDGMSDVFASHYGLSQDSADEDADGDGFTNREESRWGTDPTRHTPPFTALEPYSSDVFVFRFDSLVGKKYQVEFSGDLLSNWTVLGNTQPGTGNTIAFGSQVLGDQGFWRLAHVGDIDFDGDGLSYVEENLLQSSDSSKDTDQDYILDVNEYLAGTQPAIADPPPVVTIEPAAGDYSDAQSITLTNLALPNYIYYTEDGTEPTLFSRKYDGSAIRTKDHEIRTIRAKVILPDGTESAESAATYRVGGYTQASQTAYYGWVTADGALGYAYDPIEFASGTNLKAPKNHLVVGTGWIINGMFVPDMTVNSQELFYGITGTPTNTTWQSLEGYSTDSSVFYQSGNFRNFRPCGYGWVQRHDQMTADLQRPSQMIYYACIQFEFLSVDYPRQLYTTRAQDQHGNTFYSHKIAQGWVTSHDSMQPDTSIPSSQVRYGVVGSSPAITPVKRVASNHADAIYPTRTIRNLNSVRLGTGWAMGTDGMIPDTREPPQTLYYGEKTSYTYSNSGYERLYSTHPADITPSIARRVVTLGPGYLSSPQMSYDIVWLNNPPRAVYKGTAILNPTQLPPEINFLAYTTSELTGATSMGLGWIANGEFIEYAGTGAFDEDVDNDGLDLSEELALGTNPNYFDTDGDLIPDGFEANSIHLDPLLADPLRGEDFDGDGLDTYEELINGSDPDDFDSDKDSVWDGDEVNYGTDPDDSTSKPFDPYDFVGPSISDPNCEPIGDLGVIVNGGATAGYSVDGTVGDPSVSNSERWRLKFRGRSAESENFGVVDPFSLNLHGGAVFEISLEHVGTDPNYLAQEGVTGPDYDYEATITDMDGFLLSDPDELLGTDSDVDLGTVQAKRAYLAPLKSVSFSQSFTGGDAVGPLYRKIALNGRPLPDKKPEQESETEQYAEETYIDAFDLSLHHDTSYLYLPLASSDLVLQANASARETYWSDRAGLKPHESLTMPFGVGWSSNLCAYVEAVETFTDVVVDPISVNVIDESGRSQRFGTTDMLTFFPWPSSRVDKKTWLNTLVGYDTDNDEVVDRLVYTKKYGTELTYDLCDAWFLYSTDRVSGSNEVKRHRYWRLTEVVDRYGNDLVYDYDNYDENGNFVSENNISLIPVVINSSSHPNQFIAIDRSDNCRRIERITDSRGHTITFNYQDVQVFDTALTQLVSVDYPDKTSKAYGYQTALDVQVDSDSGDLTNHFHCNIHAITDKRGNTHRFSYDFDRSREFYTSSAGRMTFAVNINHLPDNVEADLQTQLDSMAVPSGSAEYKLMYGQPRQVTGVTLPDGLGSARFARTPESRTRYGPEFAAASGTITTDALGNST
ncbi:MAG: chitobiase/beta-hexosaminidase C-terminal domain-containing protein, partial [Coraliomargarita sp.]